MGLKVNDSYSNDSGYMSSPTPFINQYHKNNNMSCDKTLNNAGWYWGDISREFADELLSGKPEGSFLVRNSLNKMGGEYTLTLKKDGMVKLIKILHDSQNNMYGFAKPLTFSSVTLLIDFYQNHSLVEYNRTLNIKLGLPILRFTNKDCLNQTFNESPSTHNEVIVENLAKYAGDFYVLKDESIPLSATSTPPPPPPPPPQTAETMTNQSFRSILGHVIKTYRVRSRAFDQAYTEFTSLRSALGRDRRALKCVRALAASFGKQIELLTKTAESFKDELSKNERDTHIINENYTFLRCKLEKIMEAKVKLELEIGHETKRSDELEKEFNGIKPELLTLHKKKELLKRQLMGRGYNQNTIENWMAEADDEDLTLNLSSHFQTTPLYQKEFDERMEIECAAPSQSEGGRNDDSTLLPQQSNMPQLVDVECPIYVPRDNIFRPAAFSRKETLVKTLDLEDNYHSKMRSSSAVHISVKEKQLPPQLKEEQLSPQLLPFTFETKRSPNTTKSIPGTILYQTPPRKMPQHIPKPIFKANKNLTSTAALTCCLASNISSMVLTTKNSPTLTLPSQLFSSQPPIQVLSPTTTPAIAITSATAKLPKDLNPILLSNDWYTVKDANSWLLTNCDRERAEFLLRDKRVGTFLIRPSTKSAFALSIRISNNQIKHCLIYQQNPIPTTQPGRLGFVEPFPFENIYDLVDFYRVHSLEDHNPELKTNLLFPVLMI